MSGIGGGEVSGEFAFRRKIKDLENKVDRISKQLHQQQFNNQHNLSIDQTIHNRIGMLENLVRLSRTYLEESEEHYEEHADFCNYHEAWKPEEAFCTCGAINWVIDRKKIIEKLYEAVPKG